MGGFWFGKKGVINSLNKSKKGLVTISAHKMSDELKLGTLNSIFNQSQLKQK